MAEHGGRVPREISLLESLPGIGPYTARAVAATAFGQPVAAVDTNVRRVVSRVLREPMSPRQLQSAADALVYRADPVTWTHASMDLGATICRSRLPRCEECPVSSWCKSAGRVVEVSTPHMPKVPFEHTSRWLRGHIVERLRALDHGAWTRLRAPIGTHDGTAVALAISALQQDGLLEQRPDGSVRLPSSDT